MKIEILALIVFLLFIYRSYTKPLKKYEDYVQRAGKYEFIFMRQKAIRVMNMVLDEPFTDKEKASALIYLGLLHLKIKEPLKASSHFHEALQLTKDERFFYSSNLKKVIQTFWENGEQERADYWLEHLL